MRVSACTARAPAKTILLGEHWVVHGGRALAASIGLYARARCVRGQKGVGIVKSMELDTVEDIVRGCNQLCNLAAAYRYLEKLYGAVGFTCAIKSEIPPGAGLGSSAAVAVAFSAAYTCLTGNEPDPETVSRAAFEAEKVTHGRPSGVDNTVSAYGGLVVYRKGSEARRVTSSKNRLQIIIIDTRIKRSTRVAVERFTNVFKSLPLGIASKLLALNDELVGHAVKALIQGSIDELGRFMNIAHGLLQAMGVSNAELDTIVEELRSLGAYGAKLSGAGLGGVVIALAPGEAEEPITAWAGEKGYRFYRVPMPVEGVAVESIE